MPVPELDLLVDAARAGGGWAFGRLWEELSPVVHAYVRARGARDPDDTTSEVFLAAFTRLDRFDGDGRAFRSWLFTIAHHKAVDSVRRGPGAHEVPSAEVLDGRTVGSAEDSALARLGGDEALRLLDVLTPEQRSVILLRVVGDLSLEETAAVVGRPVGAVKALQHRALARLRRETSSEAVSRDVPGAIAGSR
ncbi:MAG TPA: sigma-70 family RNA polymerase sigma factor [Actinomycetes bacterium]